MKLLDFITAGLSGVAMAVLFIGSAQGVFNLTEFLVGGAFCLAAFVYSISRS